MGSITCNRSYHWYESWETDWWDTGQSEIILNDIQEKSILKNHRTRETLPFGRNDKVIPETHLEKFRTRI